MPYDRVAGLDATFRNIEATTIFAKRAVIYDVANENHVKNPTANSKYFAGITMEQLLSGKNGEIRQEGVAVVTIGAEVTRGHRAYLKYTNGKVGSVENDVTGTEQTFHVIGIFQESGSADDDEVALKITQPSEYWRA